MKIFITGATGYIGQKLVERLINKGHHIHALCRRKPLGELFENPLIKVYEGDLFNTEIIRKAMIGCEQVYHIAGYARVWAKDPKTFFEINVRGTINILDSALQLGIKKLVFTSSGTTFGISNGKPISEYDVRTVDFFNESESSKFMAEEKVQQYVRKGLNAVIVNPVRVYGPGVLTESNALSQLIKKYTSGEWRIIPGNGKSIGCFSYIDDVVDGHILAMERGVAGEKYILGGDNEDFNSFFKLLKKLSKKSYSLVKIPMPFLMAFGWQQELMASLFGKKPIITRKWVRKYNLNLAFSSEKAIRQLGYKITPLDVGITRTLQWLHNNHSVLN